jgi:hypothetical protein
MFMVPSSVVCDQHPVCCLNVCCPTETPTMAAGLSTFVLSAMSYFSCNWYPAQVRPDSLLPEYELPHIHTHHCSASRPHV